MKPSRAQRIALGHMVACEGWQDSDPVTVTAATLRALAKHGWARIEEHEGEIIAAIVTPLGRAAIRWGRAHLVPRLVA